MKVAATLRTDGLAAPIKGDRTVDLPDSVTAVIDEVSTKEIGAVRWLVVFTKSEGSRAAYELMAVHNGTAAVDADDGDFTVVGGAQTGATADDVAFDVVLNGLTGAAQRLQLAVQAPESGWKASVHRMPLVGVVP